MRAVPGQHPRASWLVVDDPVYVVELRTARGQDVEHWRLEDVDDVTDVLDWVAARRRGRLATIAVELTDHQGSTLVPLVRLGGAASLRSA